MILTNTFWPIFAISSYFSSETPKINTLATAEAVDFKGKYPGHALYRLNDGNIIPSPAWGTGTGQVRGTNATADVLRALENGWRHIDTSLNYRNQVGTGVALHKSGIPREEIYVTSKYDGIDGADAVTEIKTTLKELNLTYLDSYLIHSPRSAESGGGISKIWPQMERLKRSGLVKSIGVSNYDTVELLEELYEYVDWKRGEMGPSVNQIDYSVYNAIDVSPALAVGLKHGMLFTAYGEMRPITKNPDGPADRIGNLIAERLTREYGKTVTYSQVILAWLRSVGVLAVTTTSNEARLKEQLVPFGQDFPLLTAAEARAFELSGLGYKA